MSKPDSLLIALDALKIGLYTKDETGTYTCMNRAAIALLRRDPDRAFELAGEAGSGTHRRIRQWVQCALRNEQGEPSGSVGLAYDAKPGDPMSQDALELMKILVERSPDTLSRLARHLQENSIFYG